MLKESETEVTLAVAAPKVRLAPVAVTPTELTSFDPFKVMVKVTPVNVIAPPRRLPEKGP